MKKHGILKLIALGLIAISLLTACSSGGDKSDSENKSSTIKKRNTLPPLETSTTAATPNTAIVAETPFLTPDQLSTTWTKAKLCGLVSGKQAQQILSMKTTPTGKYVFSVESGAKCTYRSSSGEEIYIEISVSKYADARVVDTALGESSKPVTVKGVTGVSKTNSAFGVIYELNIGGEQSNQWIVNAPKESSAKSLAQALIESLS